MSHDHSSLVFLRHWAGISPPIYPRGRFGIIHFVCYLLNGSLRRMGGCKWLLDRRIRVRDEAPAVWEQGVWAVQGLQPSRTQGRQIRRTKRRAVTPSLTQDKKSRRSIPKHPPHHSRAMQCNSQCSLTLSDEQKKPPAQSRAMHTIAASILETRNAWTTPLVETAAFFLFLLLACRPISGISLFCSLGHSLTY
jgi:hypothetical protein